MSGRFVAPITNTCLRGSSPSSSVRSVLTSRADDSDWKRLLKSISLGIGYLRTGTHQTVISTGYHGVQLVKENDTRRRSSRTSKHLSNRSLTFSHILQIASAITDTSKSSAHEATVVDCTQFHSSCRSHLVEQFRPFDRDEIRSTLVRDRLGQQGLSATGRTPQQDTTRCLNAQHGEDFGSADRAHDAHAHFFANGLQCTQVGPSHVRNGREPFSLGRGLND